MGLLIKPRTRAEIFTSKLKHDTGMQDIEILYTDIEENPMH